VLDERFVMAFTIAGTADDCRALAANYAAAGTTELALTFFGPSFAADMAYLGKAFAT
jgi:5,10-methylenetetrahydromethanopterin reductase